MVMVLAFECVWYSGANGHRAAAYAKTHFPTLVNAAQSDILADPTRALTVIFQKINEGMNEDDKVDTYMSGTTAALVIVFDKKVIVANVGDTRAIIGKANGQGRAITM